jgi:hypothetical protein
MAAVHASANDYTGVSRETRSALLEYEKVGTEAYEYTELDPTKKRIRLLRLFAGVIESPQVLCELFEAEFVDEEDEGLPRKVRLDGTLADRVPYEALSWRWGDEDGSKFAITIRSDGEIYRKRVSRTLGLALKYLRGEKDRILWVDAICINQKDKEERGYQVSMMSLVYTQAVRVCVWLGEDDENSRKAIRFIREDISHLKNFDQLCIEDVHAPKWRAFIALMQRDWFSRRWVVQEIALAPVASVYCGPDELEWRELAIAVELFVEVETATHRLSELLRKDDKSRLVPNWFEHISELGASLLVNATARIFREYQRNDETPKGPKRRSLLSLEFLVTSLSIFGCGRPHDSVYALLAIARDASPVPPTSTEQKKHQALIAQVLGDQLEQKPYRLDYNSPYPDVCREFVQFCIERCAKLDPLQALDVLCRPWANDWRPELFKMDDEDDKPHPKKHGIRPPANETKQWKISWSEGEDAQKVFLLPAVTPIDDARHIPIDDQGADLGVDSGVRPEWKASWEKYNHNRLQLDSSTSLDTVPRRVKTHEDTRTNTQYFEQCKVSDFIKEAFPARSETGRSQSSNHGPPVRHRDQNDAENHAWEEYKRVVGNLNEDPKLEDIVSVKAKLAHLNKLKAEREKGKSKHAANGRSPERPPEHARIQKLGLPSWVARIGGAPFDIFPHPGMDMEKMGRKNADPLVGTPQDGHRNYSAGQTKVVDLETLQFKKRAHLGHYSLYLKGFCFDRVAKVAQVSQAGAIPASWLDLAGWSEARQPPAMNGHLDDPPTAFWRTLVADRGRNDRNPPYYYARACKETILKGGIRSNAVDTTALIHHERNSIIAEFCRRVQAVIWNRALIKTVKGALGLVSEEVKEGDLICIIYGCTVPVILRRNTAMFKTPNEYRNEGLEDGIESMKRLVRKIERYRDRALAYERRPDADRQKVVDETKTHNEKHTRKKSDDEINAERERKEDEKNIERDRLHLLGFNDPHSDTEDESIPAGDEGTRDSIDRQKERRRKAKIRDPLRHYRFLDQVSLRTDQEQIMTKRITLLNLSRRISMA